MKGMLWYPSGRCLNASRWEPSQVLQLGVGGTAGRFGVGGSAFCRGLNVTGGTCMAGQGEGGTSLYPTWFVSSGGPQGGSLSPPKSQRVLSPSFTHSELPQCRETPKTKAGTTQLTQLQEMLAHPQTPPCKICNAPQPQLPHPEGGHPCGAPGSPLEAPNLLFQPHLG